MKPIYKQLKANPKVELGFFNNKQKGGVMMRVAGEAEFLNDIELKRKLIEARPFLKVWGLYP